MPKHSHTHPAQLAGRATGVLAVAVAALSASTVSGASMAQVRVADRPVTLTAESVPEVAGYDINTKGRARNVIFIQGDGMGVAHRELLRLALKGQNGDLVMNKMQVTGLVHTDSAVTAQAVTDSAAEVIVVTPRARTAALITLAVPVTVGPEGPARSMRAPRSPAARPTTLPRSLVIPAMSCSDPFGLTSR